MEIQNIPGFRLAASPLIESLPSSKYNRGRGGGTGLKRWRTPAEVKTLDFSAGLEAYIPPQILSKRPSSSRRQRQRSKDKEIQFDNEQAESREAVTCKNDFENDLHQRKDVDSKQSWETSEHFKFLPIEQERESNFHRLTNATYQDPLKQERESDFHRLANATYQEWTDPVLPISPTWVPQEQGEVIQKFELRREFGEAREPSLSPIQKVSPKCVAHINGFECKLHAKLQMPSESPPPHSPKQWFERTLQQYEDLKKSVDAQISSAASNINEQVNIATNLNEIGVATTKVLAQSRRKDPPIAFSEDGTLEDHTFNLNIGVSASNARIAHLRKLRSEVTPSYMLSRKKASTIMHRERRALWERPEHSSGKYLIHGMSPILGISLPQNEENNNLPTTKKKNENLTTYSCGCSAKQVVPEFLTTYSCGCPAQQVLPPKSIKSNLPIPMCHCPPLQQPSSTSVKEGLSNEAMKQLVDSIDHLQKVNVGLQLTIEEFMTRERKLMPSSSNDKDSRALAKWQGPDHLIGMSEPEMRNHVVITLRTSVDRMHSLMRTLKEEQEKSEMLSEKLDGYLASKGDLGFLFAQNPTLSRATSPQCDQPNLLRLQPSPTSSVIPKCMHSYTSNDVMSSPNSKSITSQMYERKNGCLLPRSPKCLHSHPSDDVMSSSNSKSSQNPERQNGCLPPRSPKCMPSYTNDNIMSSLSSKSSQNLEKENGCLPPRSPKCMQSYTSDDIMSTFSSKSSQLPLFLDDPSMPLLPAQENCSPSPQRTRKPSQIGVVFSI